MKALFVSFLTMVSLTTAAAELNAASAFLEVLGFGTYYGVDANNAAKKCTVQVSKMTDLPYEAIKIDVKSEGKIVSKIIGSGATYRYNPGNTSYLQSDKWFLGTDFNSYLELTIRTITTNDNGLYLVANHRFVQNAFPVEDTTIECVIP